MEMTRRIKQFINEVARIATQEPEAIVTFDECIAEYTDQIINNDYCCVVYYAMDKGIKIPRALRNVAL